MEAGTRIERTMVASSSTATAEAEAHLLEHHELARGEAAEDGHHDQGGAGDDAGRCERRPKATASRVVAGLRRSAP